MATPEWNEIVTPLFQDMLFQIQQVQGEGSVNPTEPQHTPIVILSTSHIPVVSQTYRRRTRQETVVL